MAPSTGLAISGMESNQQRDTANLSPSSSQEVGTNGFIKQEAIDPDDDHASSIPSSIHSESSLSEQHHRQTYALRQRRRQQRGDDPSPDHAGRGISGIRPAAPQINVSPAETHTSSSQHLDHRVIEMCKHAAGILDAEDAKNSAPSGNRSILEPSVSVQPRNPIFPHGIEREMNHQLIRSISTLSTPSIEKLISPTLSQEPFPTVPEGSGGNNTKHRLNDSLQENTMDTAGARRIRRKTSHESDSSSTRSQKSPANSTSSQPEPSSNPQSARPTLAPEDSFNSTSSRARSDSRSPDPTQTTSRQSTYWGQPYVLATPPCDAYTFKRGSPSKSQISAERERMKRLAALNLERLSCDREALERGIKIYLIRAEELRQQLILVNLQAGEWADY